MGRGGGPVTCMTFYLFGSKISIVPALVAGFVLDWAWVYSCVLTNAFVAGNPAAATMAVFSMSVIVSSALFLLVGCILARRDMLQSVLRPVAGALLRACGVVLLGASPSLEGSALWGVALLAGLVAGAGSAALLTLWGRVLSAPSTPSVASNLSLAFVGAFAASYLLVNLTPPPAVYAFGLLAPVAECLLVRLCLPVSDQAKDSRPASQARRDAARVPSTPAMSISAGSAAPVLLALSCVLAGFLLSAFRELWVTALLMGIAGIGEMVVVVGSVGVAGLAVQCALSYGGGDDPGTRALLGTVGLCLAALLAVDPGDLLYHVVGLFAYYCLELLSWASLAGYARAAGGSATFGAGAALFFFGQALTPLSNSFITSLQTVPSLEQVASPSVLLLALFALLLVLSTGDRVEEAVSRSSMSAGVTAGTAELAARRAGRIDATVATYRLSEREADILRLVADGYSIAGMAEKLCLSENTVKTYMRRLFSKTAVHSRAELMRIVDMEG